MVHIKKFSDAYSQSREHFFLDLLKQQGAPVPQVIKNDLQNKEIHMTHVGVDLRQWLLGLDANMRAQARAMRVLYDCLVCCQTISQLNVWHLDLASRNFMVLEQTPASHATVHVIDFSLATSPQFPLQKPLWIRPHANQHHLTLQQAVIHDWQGFFQQAQLSPPVRYDIEFDIPIEDYAKTWLKQLAVDQLSHPWCVIAHSVGNLLVESSAAPCFERTVSQQLLQLGLAAKDMQHDAEAQAQIQKMMSFLLAPTSNDTPRPRAKHSIEPSPTHVQDRVIATETVQPVVNSLVRKPKFGALLFLILVVIASYGLADVLFWSYKLKLSTLSLLTMVGVSLVSVLALIAAIFSSNTYAWLFRAVQWHGLCLACLAVDLWIHDESQHWILLFLGLSLVTIWIGQKNARTSPGMN